MNQKRRSLKATVWLVVLCMMLSCVLCTSATAAEEDPPALSFAEWSLTLQNDLSLNFMVDATYFTEYGYENPEVTFVMESRTVTVTAYDTERHAGYYTFTLTDIAPHQMGRTVTATLSATYGGETVSAAAKEFSVKQYCYEMLETTNDPALKTLIVDLLNYGAATQTYVGSTDALVNADLTDAERAFGTQADVALEKYSTAKYQTVDSPSVTWVGAYLTLEDTVEMKFVFNADNVEGLRVKVSEKDPLNAEASGADYEIADLTPHEDGGWIARFDRFNATQMRKIVYVTVLDAEGNAVSNTYRYSIESYAYAKQSDADENLAALVKAMMKYGDAAAAYCPHSGETVTKIDHLYHGTVCTSCDRFAEREAHDLVDDTCTVCKADVIAKADGGWTVEYVVEGETSITVDTYDAEGNFVSRSYRLIFEGWAPDTGGNHEFGERT